MSKNMHANHTTVDRTDGFGRRDGTITHVCLTCDAVIGTTPAPTGTMQDAQAIALDYREQLNDIGRDLAAIKDRIDALNDLPGNEHPDNAATRGVWYWLSNAMRADSPLGKAANMVDYAADAAYDAAGAAHRCAREAGYVTN